MNRKENKKKKKKGPLVPVTKGLPSTSGLAALTNRDQRWCLVPVVRPGTKGPLLSLTLAVPVGKSGLKPVLNPDKLAIL